MPVFLHRASAEFHIFSVNSRWVQCPQDSSYCFEVLPLTIQPFVYWLHFLIFHVPGMPNYRSLPKMQKYDTGFNHGAFPDVLWEIYPLRWLDHSLSFPAQPILFTLSLFSELKSAKFFHKVLLGRPLIINTEHANTLQFHFPVVMKCLYKYY